jgi:hypothetical protein
MYFSHRIKKVIKFNIDGARIAKGVCYDYRDITHVTDIGHLITGEPCSTRVTRRVAGEVDCIFLAVFHTVTVITIIQAGIIPPYAEAALAFINLRAVEAVITGCGVVRVGTASRSITLIIRTFIGIIGTQCPCKIETAVRYLLAGVTLRIWTRVSRMYGTGTGTAGIGTVTVEAVITGCRVIGMYTCPRSVTGVIRTDIPVIGTGRARRIKTAVRCLLAGVTVRLRTGTSRMDRAASGAAGIGSITVEAVITGCRVSRMRTGSPTVTGVIRTDIPVIGTGRA